MNASDKMLVQTSDKEFSALHKTKTSSTKPNEVSIELLTAPMLGSGSPGESVVPVIGCRYTRNIPTSSILSDDRIR